MAVRRGPLRAVAAVIALLLVLAPVSAQAAPADDYPSWAEVEAARRDAAAAEREAARLEALLSELEAEAVRLGRDAQLRAEESFIARQELEAAVERAETLGAQTEAAEQRAVASARLASQALLALSRTGGGDPVLALLVSDRLEADELLEAIAGARRIGAASQARLDAAVADRNAADALASQAGIAEQRRADAADAAARSAEEAEAAVEAAAARAAARQEDLDRMYAQLALLRGTSAEIERAWREGQAQQQPDPGPSDPGPSDPGPQPGEPDPPPGEPDPGPTTPVPVPDKAAAAIAYARAQLGEPYVYAGAGPNGWDCSGLTMQSYASAGVAIGGHGSTSQYDYLKGKGRLVPVGQRLPGDLLFYADGGSTTAVKYHVTMYIGDGRMIEAPYPGQVVRIVAVRGDDLVPYAGRPTG